MRRLVLASMLTAIAAATHAAPAVTPAPTVEQTVERCKSAPQLCLTLIRAAAQRAVRTKQACIPKTVSPDEVAVRVMETIEEVLEEEPGLADFSYDDLAGQIIGFTWPCSIVS